jgi:hypothetical protein
VGNGKIIKNMVMGFYIGGIQYDVDNGKAATNMDTTP